MTEGYFNFPKTSGLLNHIPIDGYSLESCPRV